MNKTRMFKFVGKTWNPVKGCLHDCYGGKCWARIMAERLKAMGSKKYSDGFKPGFWRRGLRKVPKNKLVFVVSMGDMWGWWVPDDWIMGVLVKCQSELSNIYFFETKNPRRYHSFLKNFPRNTILSTTIESNFNYEVSKAPPPIERYKAMKEIQGYKKHISIEPIMEFDVPTLLDWMWDIMPDTVSVGYDNYNAGLKEPSLNKTLELIEGLEDFTEVERKSLRGFGG